MRSQWPRSRERERERQTAATEKRRTSSGVACNHIWLAEYHLLLVHGWLLTSIDSKYLPLFSRLFNVAGVPIFLTRLSRRAQEDGRTRSNITHGELQDHRRRTKSLFDSIFCTSHTLRFDPQTTTANGWNQPQSIASLHVPSPNFHNRLPSSSRRMHDKKALGVQGGMTATPTKRLEYQYSTKQPYRERWKRENESQRT